MELATRRRISVDRLTPMDRFHQAPTTRTRALTATLALVLILALAGSSLGCVSLRSWEDVRRQVPEESFVPVSLSGNGMPKAPHPASYRVYVRQEATTSTATATPILLLHGFGASSHAWSQVIPLLAERYPVLAVDLFGFGYTERPRDLSLYTRTAQTAMVLGVLDTLGYERAHLVGHSYGGALALTLAVRYPERVASLTGIDSAHPSYTQTRRRTVARLPGFNAVYLRGLGLRRSFIERALEQSYADDEQVTPEVVDAYRERLRIEGAVRAYKGLTVPQPDPGGEVQLEDVRVPTLVLWGTEDPLISVEAGRQATAKIPGASFVEVPGAGHAPHEEKPGFVADRILEFLGTLEPASP